MDNFNTIVTIFLFVPENWCPLGDLDLSTPLNIVVPGTENTLKIENKATNT